MAQNTIAERYEKHIRNTLYYMFFDIQKLNFRSALKKLIDYKIMIAAPMKYDLKELIEHYASEHRVSEWRVYRKFEPKNFAELKKFICHAGIQHEILQVNFPASGSAPLIASLRNIEFFAAEGNLEIPAEINIAEQYERAHRMRVAEKCDAIHDNLSGLEDLLKKLNIFFASKDIQWMRGKVHSYKQRAGA